MVLLSLCSLGAMSSIAEWAPAGPTVRTGRSSKIKIHKTILEPAILPARGERTGVRTNSKLFIALKKQKYPKLKQKQNKALSSKVIAIMSSFSTTEFSCEICPVMTSFFFRLPNWDFGQFIPCQFAALARGFLLGPSIPRFRPDAIVR